MSSLQSQEGRGQGSDAQTPLCVGAVKDQAGEGAGGQVGRVSSRQHKPEGGLRWERPKRDSVLALICPPPRHISSHLICACLNQCLDRGDSS